MKLKHVDKIDFVLKKALFALLRLSYLLLNYTRRRRQRRVIYDEQSTRARTHNDIVKLAVYRPPHSTTPGTLLFFLFFAAPQFNNYSYFPCSLLRFTINANKFDILNSYSSLFFNHQSIFFVLFRSQFNTSE